MSSVAERAVLFFRAYREASVPLYEANVAELCASPHLPFELATVLEDIGQTFQRLADEVNAELLRRGVLADEVDADETVEAHIEQMITDFLAADGKASRRGKGSNACLPVTEPFRQALRIALTMTHGLPPAPSR